MRIERRILVLCFVVATYALGQEAHQGGRAPAESLGRVVFPTSCNETAQKHFERGVALLHSFWYEEAVRAFEATTAADAECAMGHWGQAMSHYYQLWYPPDAIAIQKGQAAVEAARAARRKSESEAAYVAAIETFYQDAGRTGHVARALAYSDRMAKLFARYPEDREAAAFYALSLIALVQPSDKTYALQKKAAAILEPLFAEQPQHPGAAHYLIHAYDYPGLAEQGLPTARAYAKIAPSVPHALHMPSHIFTRLGLWDESIATNLAAARTAKEYGAAMKMEGTPQEQLHAMDYLIYAYLQRGRYAEARRVVEEEESLPKAPAESLVEDYARAAIPARYVVEQQQWGQAAALVVKTRFPATQAITWFARGLGAARSGNLPGARGAREALETIAGKLAAAGDRYWSEQAKIQQLAVSAWVARAEGRNDEALRLMADAAQLEDSTDKLNITPGPVAPARELLGELYLESGNAARARAEFLTSLKSSPNRARGLLGAARAAQMHGDKALAVK